MKNWIGISLGDITGIGPEVTLKAIANEAGQDAIKYLLIGDESRLRQLNSALGLDLPLTKFSSYRDSGRFSILNPIIYQIPENLPAGSSMAGSMAISWLGIGGAYCFRGELDALVTVVQELGRLTGVPTPYTDALLGLARLHARVHGLY